MTTEQITAINNAMSMLSDLQEAASMMTSLENYQEWTNQHIKALRDSGVDNTIVEHFKSICQSYLPIAEDAVRRHERYIAFYEEERKWEKMEKESHSYSLSEEDLATLQELNDILRGNHLSL